ncbi:MAG: nucleotide exchange factor GrpE [Truepera sp.]|nr:nucleotide exchange factor GrpE [Truepera sp.]
MSDRESDDTRVVEQAAAEAAEQQAPSDADTGELEILRSELATLQVALEAAGDELVELKDRYLRARADLENYRRRALQDVERAREAGLDSAILPVLTVFDDLGRALAVADEGDPGKVLPGVRSVLTALERNLDTLGIQRLGEVGDPFDPDLHEALTAVPTDEEERKGTIAEVFQAGFKRGDRLVRPARVLVFQEQ